MRIMIVDTEKKRLKKNYEIVQSVYPGRNVLMEVDPLGAVQYAFRNQVEVIFAALDMHPMSGLDIVQIMRRNKKRTKVIMTSSPQNLEDELLFEDEADGFLCDPLTKEKILSVMIDI